VQRALACVERGAAAIQEARRLLAAGNCCREGTWGFHLACDATNSTAVRELRRRKLRVDKPFAIMLPDLQEVAKQCEFEDAERDLMESTARPVVLLRRKPECIVVPEVAPGQQWLGIMLPYTPLHYLLLERAKGYPTAMVMTSGNLSEEPIAISNEDARQRLGDLADAFLMHDRDIHVRCDDSVVRISPDDSGEAVSPTSASTRSAVYPLRRSRGYAPFPVRLPWPTEPILAVAPN